MSYKEIEENDSYITFFHKDGHETRVAKKGLKPATLKKLQGFAKGGEVKQEPIASEEEAKKFAAGFESQTIAKPKVKKMADGGEVTAQEPKKPGMWDMIIPNKDTISSAIQGAADITGKFMFPKAEQQPMEGVQNVSMPGVQNAIEQGPQNVDLGLQKTQQAPTDPMLGMQGMASEQAYQQQVKGLQEEAKAASDLGQAQANIYDQQIQQQQKLFDDYQKKQAALQQEEQALKTAYANKEIDPKNLFHNMGVGQRFMTSIGLMLGGMGAGLAGGQNQALGLLNKLIDHDLEAQKENLGKGRTLLEANLKSQGNLKDAMLMSKLQLQTVASSQLEQALAKAKTPQAQAILQKQLGELQAQMAPAREQLLMRKTLMSGMGASQYKPEQRAAMAISAFVPKEKQKEANEELEMVTGYKNAIKSIDDIFSEVKGLSSVGSSIPFTESKTKFDTAVASIDLALRNSMKGQGSLTDKDMAAVTPFFPSRFDSKERLAIKEKKLKDYLANKVSKGTPTISSIPGLDSLLPRPAKTMHIGYKK